VPCLAFGGEMRALGTKSDFSGLMASASSNLPDQAVLCIRAMKGPSTNDSTLREPYGSAALEWEHAFADSIGRYARRAVRPIREFVPAGADAVLFFDQSEFLACLAKDWCGGDLASHWWWRDIFYGKNVYACAAEQWKKSSEYIPSALELLSRAGMAAKFVSRLSDGQAREIVESVNTTFALPLMNSAIERGRPSVSEPTTDSDENEKKEAMVTPAPQAPPRNIDTPRAPWLPWAPEVAFEGLTTHQQWLIGTGLMLARAPQVVRSIAFTKRVEEYLRTRGTGRPDASQPRIEEYLGERRIAQPSVTAPTPRLESGGAAAKAIIAEASAEGHETAIREELKLLPEKRVKVNAPGVASVVTPFIAPGKTPASGAASYETEKERASAPEHAIVNEYRHPALESTHTAAPREGGVDDLPDGYIATEWGGVFYFINVGLFLGLYGDFTMPVDPGIGLSPWDFCALMGMAFSDGAFSADPAWHVLAQCAGRAAKEEPGYGFDPPDSWIMPSSWLNVFPTNDAWIWDADDTRLRIAHPEGFMIIDVPMSAPHGVQKDLAVYLGKYQSHARYTLRRAPGLADGKEADPLQRWLSWVLPYIKVRLTLAMGLPDASKLTDRLLKRQATIRLTPAHLDVSFSLEELPIEVRLSGLDRNPGWVPAAGRYITFHYD